MRQDFTLYKRGRIWYGQIPDEKNPDKRIRFSTGKTTKAEAIKYCQQRFESYKGMRDTFQEATKDWWTDKCPYIRECKRNGKTIGETYIMAARSVLDNYMVPVFRNMKVNEISAGMIEDWKYELVESKGLSRKTANDYVAMLNTMFDYWWRRGDISENPCKKVRRMKVDTRPRGILTSEEAYELLTHPSYFDDIATYLANLLAACTGMRMGEIQALRGGDFSETKITVRHSWVDKTRTLKGTKTGIIREIPIDPNLRSVLLIGKMEDDFIFERDGLPMTRSVILKGLKRALNRMGIDYDEQKRRGLCFHSWRHYLNSRMRVAGIPDVITREITGHVTEKMTEHYTHISAEDSVGLLSIQSVLMEKRADNVVFPEKQIETQPVEND